MGPFDVVEFCDLLLERRVKSCVMEYVPCGWREKASGH